MLASYEITSSPTNLLVKAILDPTESVRRLAIQYTYLLWTKNHGEGGEVIKELFSKGIKVVPPRINREALGACFELESMIFQSHIREEAAIQLLNEIGKWRVKKAKRLPAVVWRIVEDVAFKYAMQTVTEMWKIDYDNRIKPIFALSEEERERVRMIIPYMDTRRKLTHNIKEILYKLALSDVDVILGIIKIILTAQVRVRPQGVLSLLRRLLASQDKSRIEIGIKSLAYASKTVPSLETEMKTAREIIYNNVKTFGGYITDFGLNISASNRGKIHFIESIILTARSEGNLEVLRKAITELGKIGIRYPDNSLDTLKEVFDIEDELAHHELIRGLAKIRTLHPDKVDRYLRKFPELLAEVKKTEIPSVYMPFYGMVDFLFDVALKSPIFRLVIIEALERFLKTHNEKEFRELLKWGWEKTTETWGKYRDTWMKELPQN